jgi:ribosomal protein S18 acetylase RimI-like enzyme
MPQTTNRLRVRAIRPDEIHTFTRVPSARDNPSRHDRLAAHLAEQWASGASRPEWCFVAEEGDEIVGRIAYWTRPRVSPGARFVNPLLFDLPWRGDYRRIGSRLLTESLDALRREGATHADLGVDAPTDFDPQVARCVGELLTEHGWELTRETLRFDWRRPPAASQSASWAAPEGRRRLSARSLEEVGEEAFVDAIRRALEGTLNRGTAREVALTGAARKARGLLDGARRLVCDGGWRADAGWWRLGYTGGGALAGFVMPAVNASGDGVLWWIGVVPEQRGRGYVDDLLTWVVETLVQAGVRRIVADTDVENWPMARAFRRTGWRQFATSATYMVSLRREATPPLG